MENKKSSPLKRLLKIVIIVFLGFLGGLLASLMMMSSTRQSANSSLTTSQVAYKNTTSTTEAVKVIQDAVVSVVNYQKESSNSIASLFGQDSDRNLNENSDLQVAGEGSGVLYKKDKKYAYLVTNNHVIQGPRKLKSYWLMEVRLLAN